MLYLALDVQLNTETQTVGKFDAVIHYFQRAVGLNCDLVLATNVVLSALARGCRYWF